MKYNSTRFSVIDIIKSRVFRHPPRAFFAILLAVSLLVCWHASARPFTDDLGRVVDVPKAPQRIISLYDVDITVPLIELGILPIASHGRLHKNGKPYLRTSGLLTGVDFNNSPITFIGAGEIDLEKITALKPDLIITAPERSVPIGPLSAIAPTVSLSASKNGTEHLYARLAELTGTQQTFSFLKSRYQTNLKDLKTKIDTGNITVNVFQPLNGKINLYKSYRSLGTVLHDAGFKFPKLTNSLPEGSRINLSAEYLPQLDADFIFDPYRGDRQTGPETEIAAMNNIVPNFCRFLSACQKGHYILISREAAISNSYAALILMTNLVKSNILSRITAARLTLEK